MLKTCALAFLLLAGCDLGCFNGTTEVTSTSWEGPTMRAAVVGIQGDGNRVAVWVRDQQGNLASQGLTRSGGVLARTDWSARQQILDDGKRLASSRDAGHLLVARGPITQPDPDVYAYDAVVGVRLGADGAPIGDRFVIAPSAGPRSPEVAFDGTRYVVAYGNSTGTWVDYVDVDGTVGAPIQVGPPDGAFSGSWLAVAARDGVTYVVWTVGPIDGSTPLQLLAARLEDGVLLDGVPIEVAADAGAHQVYLAAGLDGFLLLAWTGGFVLHAIPLSADGVVGTPVEVPTTTIDLRLVATDGAYVAAAGAFPWAQPFPSTADTVTLTWLGLDGQPLGETTSPGFAQAIDADGAALVATTLEDSLASKARALVMRTVGRDGAASPPTVVTTATYHREEHTSCEDR